MSFHSPWAFGLLVLVPVLAWWSARRGRRAAIVFPSALPLAEVPRGVRSRLTWLVPAMRSIGLSLLVVALARPQFGVGRVQTSTDAVAMQIVIDRSGSMRQEMEFDGGYATRLDVVKSVLREFALGNEAKGGHLKGRPNDLLGLVTFARQAETVCPLVRDPGTLVQLAETIPMARTREEDGTAIGDGLSLAAARLKKAEDEFLARPENAGKDLKIKTKLIILFTDGENNAGERSPEEAAELAAKWGIKVYTVGIGTGMSYQVIDFFGEKRRVPVRSSVDTRLLDRIAATTGGESFSADDADAMRRMYEEIDRLEKTSVETVEYTDYEERFESWAVAGGAVIALEAILGALVLRRVP
ncbi:MAG: VWA domain-containing protein [Phycisphaerales bacterium]